MAWIFYLQLVGVCLEVEIPAEKGFGAHLEEELPVVLHPGYFSGTEEMMSEAEPDCLGEELCLLGWVHL